MNRSLFFDVACGSLKFAKGVIRERPNLSSGMDRTPIGMVTKEPVIDGSKVEMF